MPEARARTAAVPFERKEGESMQNEVEFYCPVYEGDISQYDCDEISTGIHRGSFVNDGLPFLMELETALSRSIAVMPASAARRSIVPRTGIR